MTAIAVTVTVVLIRRNLMKPMVQKAYEALTPADCLIIDSMIMALHEKDKELSVMCTAVTKLTEKIG